jgi:hypothetical protein
LSHTPYSLPPTPSTEHILFSIKNVNYARLSLSLSLSLSCAHARARNTQRNQAVTCILI